MASSVHPAATRIWLTGASYGIGRSLAVELADSGARLALTARSEDKLRELELDSDTFGQFQIKGMRAVSAYSMEAGVKLIPCIGKQLKEVIEAEGVTFKY